ncbi:MAG: tetratricopeptide repeat protein [Rhodospirillales bacterium]|nr:tetratricopeptide repeat protein [Rhodospirillales bacterium]
MADHAQDSLFREIDEELKQEHYEKLWKKYGTYIVGAAVLIVLSVAAFKGWQAYDIKTRMAEGVQFNKALSLTQENKPEAALDAFSALADKAGDGYGLLARFQQAAHLAKSGDKTGAGDIYKKISADSGVPTLYQNLAVILGVLQDLDTADPADINARLAPLTADSNPMRYSAQELSAMLALRTGDLKKAKEIYTTLSQDAAAPSGLRTRAGELLAVLGK